MDTTQRSQPPQTPPPREQPPPQPQAPKQHQEPPRSPLRNWINWALLAALVIGNIYLFWPQSQPSSTTIPYSTFLAQVQAGNVQQVSIQGGDIRGPAAGDVLSATPGTPS